MSTYRIDVLGSVPGQAGNVRATWPWRFTICVGLCWPLLIWPRLSWGQSEGTPPPPVAQKEAAPRQPATEAAPGNDVESQESSQPSSPVPANDEAKLLDGLLDLLEPPVSQPDSAKLLENTAKDAVDAASAERPSPTSSGQPGRQAGPGSADPTGLKEPSRWEIQPADVGLSAEDLSEDPTNPMNAIRQSMLIAAGYLERGATGGDTQTIQRDIVQRLDDLISELEQAEPENRQSSPAQQPPSPSASSQQSPQETQQSSASSSSSSSATGSESQPSEGNDPQAGQSRGAGPGENGPQAQPRLELLDPVTLQQSLWGQLPERVRRQMQSRMVERFLPSYREQIEAYYQALLKLEQD